MYRIDNGSAAASLPASTAAGTAGYFTDGDPLTSTAPTILPAEWLNSIMLENLNVLTAAGITPAKNQFNQLALAIAALITNGTAILHGQCQLSIVSSNIKLIPYNGNKLLIGGVAHAIPSAGVTLSSSGTATNTLYYIYAYMNGSTMELERSGSGYATDSTTGVTTKNSDATRTLVGLAQTDGSSNWQLSRSWFNDISTSERSYFSTNRSTTSTSHTELNSEIRVSFLAWARDVIKVALNGAGLIELGGGDTGYGFMGLSIDGSNPEDNACLALGTANTGGLASDDWLPTSIVLYKKGLSEGLHYATLTAKTVVTSGTPTIVSKGSATSGERTTLTVSCGG